MPRYLWVHQVPPKVSCSSKTTKLVPGSCFVRCQALPTPEMPAPTISTSKCSTFCAAEILREGAVTFIDPDLSVVTICVAVIPGADKATALLQLPQTYNAAPHCRAVCRIQSR